MSAILSKLRNSVAPDVCSRPDHALSDPPSAPRLHDDTRDEYYYGHRTIIEYDKNSFHSLSAPFLKRCPGCTKFFPKRSTKLALCES